MKRTDVNFVASHEEDDFCAHCEYHQSIHSQGTRSHHAKTAREFRKGDKKRIMEEWGDPIKD
jgi:hypothetical protein